MRAPIALLLLLLGLMQGCASLDGLTSGDDDHEVPLPTRNAGKEEVVDKATGQTLPTPEEASQCRGVDFTSDKDNCGRCGHSCLGGACTQSKCQPITLASNLAVPQGLTVTSDAVYVTVWGANKVIRLDKSGNAQKEPETISTNTAQPWAIASTTDKASGDTRLVWGELRGSSSNVSFCSAKSCAATTMKSQATADVRQISINGSSAYWATGGTIQRCSITGCTYSFPVISNQPVLVYGVVVSDGQLAFSVAQSAGIVRRASSAGNGITDLIPALDAPQSLATDGTNLFVVANGSAVIARCPLTGGCTTTTSTIALANNPHGVAVDQGGNVYWTNGLANNGGSVAYCNPTKNTCGGKGIELATQQANPFTIAVDDEAVYWTNSVPNGSVMKIARP